MQDTMSVIRVRADELQLNNITKKEKLTNIAEIS